MEQMTILQALAEGYIRYGRDEQDYQSLSRLDELTEERLKEYNDRGINLVLADNQRIHPAIGNWEDLLDVVDDWAHESNDIADDTDDIKDLLKANVDFKGFVAKINEVLKQKTYYMTTTIRIVPSLQPPTDENKS